MRSGPGAARTILLFHIISARPSKQPRMVGTFLKVHTKMYTLYAQVFFIFLLFLFLVPPDEAGAWGEDVQTLRAGVAGTCRTCPLANPN